MHLTFLSLLAGYMSQRRAARPQPRWVILGLGRESGREPLEMGVEGAGSPVKHLSVSTLWLEVEERLLQEVGSHFPESFLPSPSFLLLLLLLPVKSGLVLPGEPAVR